MITEWKYHETFKALFKIIGDVSPKNHHVSPVEKVAGGRRKEPQYSGKEV